MKSGILSSPKDSTRLKILRVFFFKSSFLVQFLKLTCSTENTPFSQNTSMFSTFKDPDLFNLATSGICFSIIESVASSDVCPLQIHI